MIDAYASQPHYLRHLLPVWDALPNDVKGRLYLGPRVGGTRAVPVGNGPPVLVAGWRDIGRRRTILMEHGAGQSYGGDRRNGVNPSYAGGMRRNVDLFLVPGPHPAMRNRSTNPEIPCVEIGSPALDRWLVTPCGRTSDRPRIAVAFHWNGGGLCPETGWGFPEYRSALPSLTARYHVWGHGHPRVMLPLTQAYGEMGIPVVSYDKVMRDADLLVADNTSLIFEFAATGRPVVLLNASCYRRDVSHGLRFWSEADVGIQVNRPGDLLDAVAAALEDPPAQQAARAAAVSRVYSFLDGHSARRAAAAIVDHLERKAAA